MTHELKIWPQFYCRVKDGTKTFEVRKNDRNFQFGDIVILREWDPEPITGATKAPKGYTDSPELTFKIGFILVLDSSTVAFSLLPIKKVKEI